MIDVPHFSLPLRFDRGAAVVVEQDSTDEIVGCCLSILLCPLGFRAELPAYGVDDPTFSEGNVVGVDSIASAVRQWEPRADLTFEQHADAADELIAHVTAAIGAPSTD
jgi:phage baseplate assembly protein W